MGLPTPLRDLIHSGSLPRSVFQVVSNVTSWQAHDNILVYTDSIIGDDCGASYLNQNFIDILREKLCEESYLEDNGDTIESHINSAIANFEEVEKRYKDNTKTPSSTTRVRIPGLRGDIRRARVGQTPVGFENGFVIFDSQITIHFYHCRGDIEISF